MLKITCTTTFLFFMFTTLKAQLEHNNLRDSGYVRALKYIESSNKGHHILVSDTVIRLDFTSFTEELDSLQSKQNHTTTIDLLDSVDQSNSRCQKFMPILKGQKQRGLGNTKIIYFSPFYKNMVVGEILDRKNDGWSGPGHREQAGFNESTQYLFIFDEKYRIQKVFKIRMAYD